MKNLLFLLVICLLSSCGKENPEPQKKLAYPLKYVLGDYSPGELNLYKISGTDFESIPLSGSFVSANMYLDTESNSEETKDELISFKTIELLDEKNVQVEFELSTGEKADTIIPYVENNGLIQVYVDSTDYFAFETTDDNSFLRFKFPAYWLAFTNDRGEWDYSPINSGYNYSASDEEWINSIFEEYKDRSFVRSIDTIALKYSGYLYPLEE